MRAGLVDGLLAVDAADRPDVAEVVQLRIVQAQVQLFLLRVLDGAGKDANGRTWGDDVDGETLRQQASLDASHVMHATWDTAASEALPKRSASFDPSESVLRMHASEPITAWLVAPLGGRRRVPLWLPGRAVEASADQNTARRVAAAVGRGRCARRWRSADCDRRRRAARVPRRVRRGAPL